MIIAIPKNRNDGIICYTVPLSPPPLNLFGYSLRKLLRVGFAFVFNSNTVLTDTYVKVYLVKGKKCVEKHRTKTMKESLQPKYMEMLKFKSSPAGCLIQVRAFFNVFFFLRFSFYFALVGGGFLNRQKYLYDSAVIR